MSFNTNATGRQTRNDDTNLHVDNFVERWCDLVASKVHSSNSSFEYPNLTAPKLTAFQRRIALIRRAKWWLYSATEVKAAKFVYGDVAPHDQHADVGELLQFMCLCKYLASGDDDASLSPAGFRECFESLSAGSAVMEEKRVLYLPPMSTARFLDLYDHFDTGDDIGDDSTPASGRDRVSRAAASLSPATTSTTTCLKVEGAGSQNTDITIHGSTHSSATSVLRARFTRRGLLASSLLSSPAKTGELGGLTVMEHAGAPSAQVSDSQDPTEPSTPTMTAIASANRIMDNSMAPGRAIDRSCLSNPPKNGQGSSGIQTRSSSLLPQSCATATSREQSPVQSAVPLIVSNNADRVTEITTPAASTRTAAAAASSEEEDAIWGPGKDPSPQETDSRELKRPEEEEESESEEGAAREKSMHSRGERDGTDWVHWFREQDHDGDGKLTLREVHAVLKNVAVAQQLVNSREVPRSSGRDAASDVSMASPHEDEILALLEQRLLTVDNSSDQGEDSVRGHHTLTDLVGYFAGSKLLSLADLDCQLRRILEVDREMRPLRTVSQKGDDSDQPLTLEEERADVPTLSPSSNSPRNLSSPTEIEPGRPSSLAASSSPLMMPTARARPLEAARVRAMGGRRRGAENNSSTENTEESKVSHDARGESIQDEFRQNGERSEEDDDDDEEEEEEEDENEKDGDDAYPVNFRGTTKQVHWRRAPVSAQLEAVSKDGGSLSLEIRTTGGSARLDDAKEFKQGDASSSWTGGRKQGSRAFFVLDPFVVVSAVQLCLAARCEDADALAEEQLTTRGREPSTEQEPAGEVAVGVEYADRSLLTWGPGSRAALKASGPPSRRRMVQLVLTQLPHHTRDDDDDEEEEEEAGGSRARHERRDESDSGGGTVSNLEWLSHVLSLSSPPQRRPGVLRRRDQREENADDNDRGVLSHYNHEHGEGEDDVDEEATYFLEGNSSRSSSPVSALTLHSPVSPSPHLPFPQLPLRATLRHMELSHSGLTDTALERGAYAEWARCTGLTGLDLSFNKLRAPPQVLPPNLRTLTLASNCVRTLAFLETRTTLRTLDVSSNELATLSQLFSLAPLQRSLVALDLSSNPLAAHAPRYRKSVLDLLPALNLLDRTHVDGDRSGGSAGGSYSSRSRSRARASSSPPPARGLYRGPPPTGSPCSTKREAWSQRRRAATEARDDSRVEAGKKAAQGRDAADNDDDAGGLESDGKGHGRSRASEGFGLIKLLQTAGFGRRAPPNCQSPPDSLVEEALQITPPTPEFKFSVDGSRFSSRSPSPSTTRSQSRGRSAASFSPGRGCFDGDSTASGGSSRSSSAERRKSRSWSRSRSGGRSRQEWSAGGGGADVGARGLPALPDEVEESWHGDEEEEERGGGEEEKHLEAKDKGGGDPRVPLQVHQADDEEEEEEEEKEDGRTVPSSAAGEGTAKKSEEEEAHQEVGDDNKGGEGGGVHFGLAGRSPVSNSKSHGRTPQSQTFKPPGLPHQVVTLRLAQEVASIEHEEALLIEELQRLDEEYSLSGGTQTGVVAHAAAAAGDGDEGEAQSTRGAKRASRSSSTDRKVVVLQDHEGEGTAFDEFADTAKANHAGNRLKDVGGEGEEEEGSEVVARSILLASSHDAQSHNATSLGGGSKFGSLSPSRSPPSSSSSSSSASWTHESPMTRSEGEGGGGDGLESFLHERCSLEGDAKELLRGALVELGASRPEHLRELEPREVDALVAPLKPLQARRVRNALASLSLDHSSPQPTHGLPTAAPGGGGRGRKRVKGSCTPAKFETFRDVRRERGRSREGRGAGKGHVDLLWRRGGSAAPRDSRILEAEGQTRGTSSQRRKRKKQKKKKDSEEEGGGVFVRLHEEHKARQKSLAKLTDAREKLEAKNNTFAPCLGPTASFRDRLLARRRRRGGRGGARLEGSLGVAEEAACGIASPSPLGVGGFGPPAVPPPPVVVSLTPSFMSATKSSSRKVGGGGAQPRRLQCRPQGTAGDNSGFGAAAAGALVPLHSVAVSSTPSSSSSFLKRGRAIVDGASDTWDESLQPPRVEAAALIAPGSFSSLPPTPQPSDSLAAQLASVAASAQTVQGGEERTESTMMVIPAHTNDTNDTVGPEHHTHHTQQQEQCVPSLEDLSAPPRTKDLMSLLAVKRAEVSEISWQLESHKVAMAQLHTALSTMMMQERAPPSCASPALAAPVTTATTVAAAVSTESKEEEKEAGAAPGLGFGATTTATTTTATELRSRREEAKKLEGELRECRRELEGIIADLSQAATTAAAQTQQPKQETRDVNGGEEDGALLGLPEGLPETSESSCGGDQGEAGIGPQGGGEEQVTTRGWATAQPFPRHSAPNDGRPSSQPPPPLPPAPPGFGVNNFRALASSSSGVTTPPPASSDLSHAPRPYSPAAAPTFLESGVTTTSVTKALALVDSVVSSGVDRMLEAMHNQKQQQHQQPQPQLEQQQQEPQQPQPEEQAVLSPRFSTPCEAALTALLEHSVCEEATRTCSSPNASSSSSTASAVLAAAESMLAEAAQEYDGDDNAAADAAAADDPTARLKSESSDDDSASVVVYEDDDDSDDEYSSDEGVPASGATGGGATVESAASVEPPESHPLVSAGSVTDTVEEVAGAERASCEKSTGGRGGRGGGGGAPPLVVIPSAEDASAVAARQVMETARAGEAVASVVELNVVLERLHVIEAFKARAKRLQRQHERLGPHPETEAGSSCEDSVQKDEDSVRLHQLEEEQRTLETWVLGLSQQQSSPSEAV